MAFSATCPTISDEQFRAEYESLSLEEKANIRNDLYGFPLSDHDEEEHVTVEDKDCSSIAIQLFYEALSSIPKDKKVSYEKAKSLNPYVVENECNPLMFLRRDNWDPWAAACRMVEYWQVRGELFGGNFARPMTVGEALSNPQDLEFMKQGVVIMLPIDQLGRAAFQWDRILQKQIGCDRITMLKIFFFYVFQKLAMTKEGQRNGVMCMFNMRDYNFYRHWDRTLIRTAYRIATAIPMRMRAIHLVTGSGPGVVSNFVLPVVRPLFTPAYRQRIVLHSGSIQEVLTKLKILHFILPENLGTRLGGTYTNEQFWSHVQKLDQPKTKAAVVAFAENDEPSHHDLSLSVLEQQILPGLTTLSLAST